MSLNDVLEKINETTSSADVPANDRREVIREFVLIRDLLNALLENYDLNEEEKQEQFNKRLMALVVEKDTAVNHQYVLGIVDKVCQEANVSIMLKPKIK